MRTKNLIAYPSLPSASDDGRTETCGPARDTSQGWLWTCIRTNPSGAPRLVAEPEFAAGFAVDGSGMSISAEHQIVGFKAVQFVLNSEV
ncbi:MAG: hypothetical protein P4L99_06690 [Chthoniobacter sp.]|nr:hypothetical protein [Chthoniobacter sp.]